MFFGFNLLASKNLFDKTFFVDDKSGTDSTHGLFAIHQLLAPCAHRLKQGVIYISNQREWQIVLLFEFDM